MTLSFWSRFFRRKPRRIYLGQLTVTPRTDFLRHHESRGLGIPRDGDLRTYLADWLQLPDAPTPEAVQESDLALDVVLKSYRLGDAMVGDPIPIVFWRPMVEVETRAYFVKSGQNFMAIKVKHRMPWPLFLKRLLSIRFWFLPVAAASKEDMRWLLGEALLQVVSRLRAQA